MKAKRWLAPLVLAAFLVGFTTWVVAQEAPAGPQHGIGHWRGHPPGPGDHANFGRLLHTLRAASDLDLTDAQLEQIEAIVEDARPQFEALGEQIRTQMEAWQEANDPAVFDEAAAREFIEAQSVLHADMALLGMRTRAQVLSILTPDQRDALQAMKDSMKERFRGKRHSKRPS